MARIGVLHRVGRFRLEHPFQREAGFEERIQRLLERPAIARHPDAMRAKPAPLGDDELGLEVPLGAEVREIREWMGDRRDEMPARDEQTMELAQHRPPVPNIFQHQWTEDDVEA